MRIDRAKPKKKLEVDFESFRTKEEKKSEDATHTQFRTVTEGISASFTEANLKRHQVYSTSLGG